MSRRRRNRRSFEQDNSEVSSTSGCESNNLTVLTSDTSRYSEINLSVRKQNATEEINNKTRQMLELCDVALSSMISTIPEGVLNEEVDLHKSGDFIKIVKELFIAVNVESTAEHFARSGKIKTVKKRRCRSSDNRKENAVDSVKTISPPSSAFKVRRVMKTNEEAISEQGSPLFVQSTIVEAPRVIIPLEGGNVLNIEPRKARKPTQVPNLSPKTKKQLEILRENIDKCLSSQGD